MSSQQHCERCHDTNTLLTHLESVYVASLCKDCLNESRDVILAFESTQHIVDCEARIDQANAMTAYDGKDRTAYVLGMRRLKNARGTILRSDIIAWIEKGKTDGEPIPS